MIEDRVVSAIVGAYAAFAADAIDSYFDGDDCVPLHSDVDWVEPGSFAHGGAYRGPEAVRGYLQRSRDGWSDISSTVRRVLADEDKVAILVQHQGTRTTGDVADVHVLDVFEVRDGLVVRMEAFGERR